VDVGGRVLGRGKKEWKREIIKKFR